MRKLAALAFPLLVAGCSMESKFAGPKPAVHIAIARDGTASMNGKTVSPNELTTQAHAQPDAHFVVDAEREVSFQVLLSTLERLRAGGANDIALGTVLARTAPPPTTAPAPTQGPTESP